MGGRITTRISYHTTIYKTQINDNATFAWVIVPNQGKVPEIQAEWIGADASTATLKIENTTLQIPLQSGKPLFK